MLIVGLTAMLLVVLCTVLHYEALRAMSYALPRLVIPTRSKLLLVILGAFMAHALEMFMYGFSFYFLSGHLDLGSLGAGDSPTLSTCLYFSVETYTSLGYGDVVPHGPVRMLAGIETLNGLLLIGWTASYTYLSMERFWVDNGARKR
jgi:hypothetical protein